MMIVSLIKFNPIKVVCKVLTGTTQKTYYYDI